MSMVGLQLVKPLEFGWLLPMKNIYWRRFGAVLSFFHDLRILVTALVAITGVMPMRQAMRIDRQSPGNLRDTYLQPFGFPEGSRKQVGRMEWRECELIVMSHGIGTSLPGAGGQHHGFWFALGSTTIQKASDSDSERKSQGLSRGQKPFWGLLELLKWEAKNVFDFSIFRVFYGIFFVL